MDFVLISHSDLAHIGALPYARKHFGLKAPVYATIPVFTMGQMFLYDVHQAKVAVEEFKTFTLDDVDDTFKEQFVQVKYSQHVRLTGTSSFKKQLSYSFFNFSIFHHTNYFYVSFFISFHFSKQTQSGKGKGIIVTPYAAGRTLGGAIWRITKETEDIVYAVDYNHKKERHLNATVLERADFQTKPTLFITDATQAAVTVPPRKDLDKRLIDSIMATLRGGGNVLIPTDTGILVCSFGYFCLKIKILQK